MHTHTLLLFRLFHRRGCLHRIAQLPALLQCYVCINILHHTGRHTRKPAWQLSGKICSPALPVWGRYWTNVSKFCGFFPYKEAWGRPVSAAVRQHGFPYKWVQRMCGVDLNPEGPDSTALQPLVEVSAKSLEAVVGALKGRFICQVHLTRQIVAMGEFSGMCLCRCACGWVWVWYVYVLCMYECVIVLMCWVFGVCLFMCWCVVCICLCMYCVYVPYSLNRTAVN